MAFGIAQSKSILTSKTFYGSLIGLVSVLFPHFFTRLTAAIGINDPNQIAVQIVGFAGAAFAIYGRFAATQPVTLTGGPTLVQSQQPAESSGDSTTTRKMALIETTTKIIPVDEHGNPAPQPDVAVANKATEKWPELNSTLKEAPKP